MELLISTIRFSDINKCARIADINNSN